MSVTGYHEDEEIANKQERVLFSHMAEELKKQYGEDVVNFDGLHQKTNEFFSELFRNAGLSIGQWPNSSAYYGVDVIYDAKEIFFRDSSSPTMNLITPQPKLVEVNFLGDWHVCEISTAKENISLYHELASDLLYTIATDCDLKNHPRLIPL